MPDHATPAPPAVAVRIAGGGLYPMRRVLRIGRNRAARAVEMGEDPDQKPPFFFHVTPRILGASGRLSTPTQQKVEMAAMPKSGGTGSPVDGALDHVFGPAPAPGMTWYDPQGEPKKMGRPREIGNAAQRFGPVHPAARIGRPNRGRTAPAFDGA